MKIFALQIKKNDRWIYCTQPGTGRLIVSQDQAKFEGFGDRFRVITFPGFVDNDEWESGLLDSIDISPVTKYTVSIIPSQPAAVLRYADLSEALGRFEASEFWTQDALITMSPQHYRALRMIRDEDNQSIVQREAFLGDAPATLFGHPIEVRAGETNIKIQTVIGGQSYILA